MVDFIQFFNIDLLNTLAVYFLSSSFFFLIFYFNSGWNFNTALKLTLIYICLAPAIIPLTLTVFNYFVEILNGYGIYKYVVSNFLLLEHWNIQTIGKLYYKFILISLCFLILRVFARDSLKDILSTFLFLALICVPAMIVFLYFLLVLFNLIDYHIISRYGLPDLIYSPFAVWVVIPIVFLLICGILSLTKKKTI